jgi:putative transposase
VDDVARLTARTEFPLTTALKVLAIRKTRFYDWKKRYGQKNCHNGQIPKDSWILPSERQSIVDYYSKNPGNGCRRLAYMMMDENVVFVSGNTVHRVLSAEGLINKSSQKPSLKGKGFDQPAKPHEQWHIDVSYINAGGTFYYLCSILDGYSRFIVHWELSESMKEEKVEMIVQRALENAGHCNPRLISDNGPQFKAREFKVFIRLCGMDQTFTSPYYPQSNGKIERWHKELKQTCIRPRQPRNLDEAKRYVSEFIEQYNYSRLHSAIGYVTPYDKLLGLDADLKVERKKKLDGAREARKRAWKQIQHQPGKKELAISA